MKHKSQFSLTQNSDGVITAYVNGHCYKYVMDLGRFNYLKTKLAKSPGKLFNAVKAEGEMIDAAKICECDKV